MSDVLEAFGWQWRDNGADVFVRVSGRTHRVFVPLRKLYVAFGNEFAAIGCPIEATISGPPSVGGLFSSIKKLAKKAGKAAKGAVKRAVRTVKTVARSTARRVYRGARGVARHSYGAARALSRGNVTGALGHAMGGVISNVDVLDPTGLTGRVMRNPMARQAMVAASAAFPLTAPFAPAIAAANKAYGDFQRGRQAASAIRAGQRSPQLLQMIDRGLNARSGVASMARLAQYQDPRAMQIMGAFNQLGQLGF